MCETIVIRLMTMVRPNIYLGGGGGVCVCVCVGGKLHDSLRNTGGAKAETLRFVT